MSPEAQRIAIAEACGTHTSSRVMRSWNPGALPPESVLVITDSFGRSRFQWDYASSTDNGFEEPADYLNDLNAMHEAEKVPTKDQHDSFRDHLKEICLRDWISGKHYTPFGDSATAAQRAEAFLRTLNK